MTAMIVRKPSEIILADTLGTIMHEHTIDEILDALSDICYGESTYHRYKRSDKTTAKKYDSLCRKLSKLKL